MSTIIRIVTAALISFVLIGTNAFADTSGKPISIPAGDLHAALQKLVRATGAQLLYDQNQVEGLRTKGVRDAKSPEAAVAVLLEGTSLKSRVDASGAILIVTTSGASSNAAPADQMRVAMEDSSNQTKKSATDAAEPKNQDQVVVHDKRIAPFSDANVDLPRTINDARPYYIFDHETIDRSGAMNIEDFLKQRLTMNTVSRSNRQRSSGAGSPNTEGNNSLIDLRGLGEDKTLILVNGRRIAGAFSSREPGSQTDLNGIPLSAIDRIEVLPSSASGIYGGSAIGGVVNVILKKDYVGGEVRMSYDNAWRMDSPARTVSATYGMALEGGKTHLMLTGQWSEAEPLLLGDRRELYDRNLDIILRNQPGFVYPTNDIRVGALPNIMPFDPTVTSLTLKEGNVSLGSRITHIAAGTSPNTSSAELAASLLANAGSWNLDLPDSTQQPIGLRRPFGNAPTTRSMHATVYRELLPQLEAFMELSYAGNRTESIYNAHSGLFSVPDTVSTNPFTTAVWIMVPLANGIPITTDSLTRSATAGVKARFPHSWIGQFDYTWSENRYNYLFNTVDTLARNADRNNGTLNYFVDTLIHPLNLEKYAVSNEFNGASRLQSFSLRGSGPLLDLPWGAPQLTFGLERRLGSTPEYSVDSVFPVTTANNNRITYYARKQRTDSVYAEGEVPLVAANRFPLLHALSLQITGRTERYTVDTGTNYVVYWYNLTPPFIGYDGTTLNGEPYFSKASYESTDRTVGLKYQPVAELILRASVATAFTPPRPGDLLKNPLPNTYRPAIHDPKTGINYPEGIVQTISGGNPDLLPENSRSLNAGIIWEPRAPLLKGLRFNIEYYRIEQFDAIGTLSAQRIVDLEDTYSGRVTRDASGAITMVDTSYVNLYRRDTQGWDLGLDYSVNTARGTFHLRFAESSIRHLKNQYSTELPELEGAGFHPSEDNGGAPKHKSSTTLVWEREGWTAGWTTSYVGSYKQMGATGGPIATLWGTEDPLGFIDAQGSDTVSSQIYHDAFASYTFGARSGAVLAGASLSIGVRNVFDKAPPLDVYYDENYYLSPFGDTRLRSYWINLKKGFGR